MIQQQAQWGINLPRCHVWPPDVSLLPPPPRSSNISCPWYSLYDNGMIFKACPLSAVLWQEITLEGGRRITEGAWVLLRQLWWFTGSPSTLPEWRTHHQSGTACVCDGQLLRFLSFKVHFVPPASRSLRGHPLMPTLSYFAAYQTKELPVRSKSKPYYYYFFNAETG